MEVVLVVNGMEENRYASIDDFANDVEGVYFDRVNRCFYVTDIRARYFIKANKNLLYVSRSLKLLNVDKSLEFNPDAIAFYRKFNFIYPPFTQYKNVYLMTPHVAFRISNSGIKFSSSIVLDDNKNSSDNGSELVEELKEELAAALGCKEHAILVSGGIDSSSLLGVANEKGIVANAYMCKMSSIPKEEQVARTQCNELTIPFTLLDLDKDLSSRAKEFIDQTGEVISDPIAIVFAEMLEQISALKNGSMPLIDGQGADSLFNGLPHNKLLNLYHKTHWCRLLLKPFGYMPVYTDKSSPLNRKLYRISKVIRCLSYSSFSDVLINSLVIEETEKIGLVEKYFKEELDRLFESMTDWHKVIRSIFLFRILPARELQKYLLCSKYDIEIVTPFLYESFIETFNSLPHTETIQRGIYKAPVTKLARNYWPDFFQKSSTSPFQVNYTIDSDSITDFSIETLTHGQ